MHEPIRDNLEEYLKGSASKGSRSKISQDFQAHLEVCEDCAGELRDMEAQAGMLHVLRPGKEVEPGAGFYARVMDRIEAQGRASIWAVMLEPAFGRRLAVACAMLVVLLGTYFVATELSEPMVAVAPSMASSAPASADPGLPPSADRDNAQREQQRDAVLVNLASFHE